MAQAALIAQVAAPIFGGMAGKQEAAGEKLQADINADIAKTRAIQDGTTKAEQTVSELATMRATMASNGQGVNSGTAPFMQELRRVRSREARITQGNHNRQAEDYKIQGRNAENKGRNAMTKGILGAAKPAFSLYDLNRG